MTGAVTRGERWEHSLWHKDSIFNTYGELADLIYDSLQDWICETSFGWGQLRSGTYVIPGAAT